MEVFVYVNDVLAMKLVGAQAEEWKVSPDELVAQAVKKVLGIQSFKVFMTEDRRMKRVNGFLKETMRVISLYTEERINYRAQDLGLDEEKILCLKTFSK